MMITAISTAFAMVWLAIALTIIRPNPSWRGRGPMSDNLSTHPHHLPHHTPRRPICGAVSPHRGHCTLWQDHGGTHYDRQAECVWLVGLGCGCHMHDGHPA